MADRKRLFDTEKYFEGLDSNHDGFIDYTELEAALLVQGVPVSPALVKSIMKKVDTSGDGKISFEEFKEFTEVQNEKLAKVFDKLDKSNRGYIGREDIKEAIDSLLETHD
jgi:solute carrier family 25 phosphate transporter 23/24/25/41